MAEHEKTAVIDVGGGLRGMRVNKKIIPNVWAVAKEKSIFTGVDF